MQGEFSGKVVVIAGGSRGIGRGIATAFAEAGAETMIVSSSETNLEAAAEAIAKDGAAKPKICAADLRLEEGCDRVLAEVDKQFGRCDILVNSAGATRAGAFLDQPEEQWQDGFALKFFGCVRLCRLFWPMLKEAQGYVVNIVGGAVNAAMSNFSKGLAGLGKRDGVNVNAILPGLNETERVQQLFQQRAEATGKTPEQERADAIANEGLRRLGQPEDVSALALFLCSESSRHIQGTAIAVDGGATPGLY